MKQEVLVAIAVRVVALLIALKSIGMMVQLALSLGEDQVRLLKPAVELGLELFLLAVAYGLWRFPLTIARKLLPMTPAHDVSDTSAHELMVAGVTVIGIWFTAKVAMDLVFWFSFFANMSSANLLYADLNPDQKASFIASFFELAIGLWLTFGAHGLIGFIRIARQAGSAKAT